MTRRVLIIDDDPAVPAVIAEILTSFGHAVDQCADGASGLERALANEYNLVLVDLVMPGMNGAEVTEQLLSKRPDTCIVAISGHPGTPEAKRALEAGARAVIPKPFEIATILDHLESCRNAE